MDGHVEDDAFDWLKADSNQHFEVLITPLGQRWRGDSDCIVLV